MIDNHGNSSLSHSTPTCLCEVWSCHTSSVDAVMYAKESLETNKRQKGNNFEPCASSFASSPTTKTVQYSYNTVNLDWLSSSSSSSSVANLKDWSHDDSDWANKSHQPINWYDLRFYNFQFRWALTGFVSSDSSNLPRIESAIWAEIWSSQIYYSSELHSPRRCVLDAICELGVGNRDHNYMQF